ncbi:hypothetical protein ACFY2K_26280 [Kitasatospora sp. NPDC001309]|uniref:hypothetical protein n=1 Tax=Kitasatospora sp. NPDC001309 TaxID=3364013 RepID=UPI0036CB9180
MTVMDGLFPCGRCITLMYSFQLETRVYGGGTRGTMYQRRVCRDVAACFLRMANPDEWPEFEVPEPHFRKAAFDAPLFQCEECRIHLGTDSAAIELRPSRVRSGRFDVYVTCMEKALCWKRRVSVEWIFHYGEL